MSESLRECIQLLERLRDTYLSNHQTEREVITRVVASARKSLEVEVVKLPLKKARKK